MGTNKERNMTPGGKKREDMRLHGNLILTIIHWECNFNIGGLYDMDV